MGIERRAVVDAAVERGWEIVAHNYVQTDLLTDFHKDPEREREVIRETLRICEETTGKRPKGWLSSSLRSTPNTADLLGAPAAASSPMSPAVNSDRVSVKALFDFEGVQDGDLPFKDGDTFEADVIVLATGYRQI